MYLRPGTITPCFPCPQVLNFCGCHFFFKNRPTLKKTIFWLKTSHMFTLLLSLYKYNIFYSCPLSVFNLNINFTIRLRRSFKKSRHWMTRSALNSCSPTPCLLSWVKLEYFHKYVFFVQSSSCKDKEWWRSFKPRFLPSSRFLFFSSHLSKFSILDF